MTNTRLQLKLGDFIEGTYFKGSEQSRPIFGVVSHVKKGEPTRYQNLLYCTQSVDCFLNGVIDKKDDSRLWTGRGGEDIRKLSQEESLAFLQKVWGQFETEIESGGLKGALFARRQYNLKIVMEIIEETSHPLEAIRRAFPTPNTGIYVLQAYIGGQEFLEGLVAEPHRDDTKPRRNEITVAKLAGLMLPEETTCNIPSEYEGTKLRAYEIPKRGIHLVTPRLKLTAALNREPLI